jgi:hypothetical protein
VAKTNLTAFLSNMVWKTLEAFKYSIIKEIITMAKISQQALSEVKGAYQVYEKEVQASSFDKLPRKHI